MEQLAAYLPKKHTVTVREAHILPRKCTMPPTTCFDQGCTLSERFKNLSGLNLKWKGVGCSRRYVGEETEDGGYGGRTCIDAGIYGECGVLQVVQAGVKVRKRERISATFFIFFEQEPSRQDFRSAFCRRAVHGHRVF